MNQLPVRFVRDRAGRDARSKTFGIGWRDLIQLTEMTRAYSRRFVGKA